VSEIDKESETAGVNLIRAAVGVEVFLGTSSAESEETEEKWQQSSSTEIRTGAFKACARMSGHRLSWTGSAAASKKEPDRGGRMWAWTDTEHICYSCRLPEAEWQFQSLEDGATGLMLPDRKETRNANMETMAESLCK